MWQPVMNGAPLRHKGKYAAFRRLRSEDDIFSGLDESTLADVDENDPRSVARWVRRMSGQMGEPLEPDMEADLERMEAGEMPDDFGDDGDAADAFAQE